MLSPEVKHYDMTNISTGAGCVACAWNPGTQEGEEKKDCYEFKASLAYVWGPFLKNQTKPN